MTASIPIPRISIWQDQMIHWGNVHGGRLLSDYYSNFDLKLNAVYYDAAQVFYDIFDYYTGLADTNFLDYGNAALAIYNQYIEDANFVVPGYWAFGHGLQLAGFLKENPTFAAGIPGDPFQSLIDLSVESLAARDSTPLSFTEIDPPLTSEEGGAREAAYALQLYMLAEQLEYPPGSVRTKRDAYVNQLLGHFDQWFVAKTAIYVRPFMVALAAQALIEWTEHVTYMGYAQSLARKPEIISALTLACDELWNTCWPSISPTTSLPIPAFQYTDRVHSSGGIEPAPDLNLLIAPMYAWVYHQTGILRMLERGDEVFAGGVPEYDEWGFAVDNDQASVNQPKQFNQMYRWSMKYPIWRLQNPLSFDAGENPGGEPPIEISYLDATLISKDDPSAMILPINRRTWEQHFVENDWETIEDQVNDEYPIYIQPGNITATFDHIIDLQATIPAGKFLATLDKTDIAGLTTATPTIYLGTDAVPPVFTEYEGEWSVYGTNYRYARVRIEFDGGDDKSVCRVNALAVRVSLKSISDSGRGFADLGDVGGTPVLFSKTFVDISSVSVSPRRIPNIPDDEQPIAIYDFEDVPNPTGFTVFLYNRKTGARLSGEFSWSADGV